MLEVWKIRSTIALIAIYSIAAVDGRLKTAQECEIGFATIDEKEVENSLAGCLLGAQGTCCSGIDKVFGVASDTPVASCLCDDLVLEEVLRQIDAHPLAATFGYNGDRVLGFLEGCNADYGPSPKCTKPISRAGPPSQLQSTSSHPAFHSVGNKPSRAAADKNARSVTNGSAETVVHSITSTNGSKLRQEAKVVSNAPKPHVMDSERIRALDTASVGQVGEGKPVVPDAIHIKPPELVYRKTGRRSQQGSASSSGSQTLAFPLPPLADDAEDYVYDISEVGGSVYSGSTPLKWSGSYKVHPKDTATGKAQKLFFPNAQEAREKPEEYNVVVNYGRDTDAEASMIKYKRRKTTGKVLFTTGKVKKLLLSKLPLLG